MTKTAYLLVIGFFLATAAQAQLLFKSQWNYSITTTVHGQKYTQKLSSYERPDYPLWNFETEPCPLPSTNAAVLARSALLTLLTDGAVPELKAITLKMLYEHIWLYEVYFLIPDSITGDKTGCTILVGMDGNVPAISLKTQDAAKQADGTDVQKPEPVLLTPEQDEKLVEEGVLPPRQANP